MARTDEWPTPQWLVDQLAAEFGPFDLDPAATPGNAKAPVQRPPASRVPLATYRLTVAGIEAPDDPPLPVQLSFDDLIA